MVEGSKGVGVPEVMSVRVLGGWTVMGVVTDAMLEEGLGEDSDGGSGISVIAAEFPRCKIISW